MRWLFLLALAAGAASAQPLGFGIKLGTTLNDRFQVGGTGVNNAQGSRFTVGPMAELRFPFGVALEADFLYKRLEGSYLAQGAVAASKANAWELPVLLKYRFGFPVVKPYLSVGPSFRWLTNVNQTVSCLGGCGIGYDVHSDRSGTGLAFAGGLEVKLLVIRVAPELRYTRWGSDALSVGQVLLRSQRNQAEFLVGISF